MPAESEKVRRLMGLVYSAKKGKTSLKKLKSPAKKTYRNISKEEARKMAMKPKKRR